MVQTREPPSAPHIPSREDLQWLARSDLVDSKGQTVPFGDLTAGSHKTICFFVRHLLCGKCKAYVLQICEKVTPAMLERANAKVVIISCGSWQPITDYAKDTGCPYPIYCDPDRSMYIKLDFSYTLDLNKGSKASYLANAKPVAQVFSAIFKALSNISWIGKTGDIKQNGGEVVFEGSDKCLFIHRMQNTEDHAELSEVLEAASIPFPA